MKYSYKTPFGNENLIRNLLGFVADDRSRANGKMLRWAKISRFMGEVSNSLSVFIADRRFVLPDALAP
jgi:hypothetical protein